MPLKTDLLIRLEAIHSKIGDLITASGAHQLIHTLSLTDGTAANQADVAFSDERTLAASATEDLDLAAGGLTDIFGAAFAPARLKVFAVKNTTALGGNNLNVIRPASNGVPWALAAGDGVAVRPQETKILIGCQDATGVVVTAATGDLITFTNAAGSTSVTYKVLLIGASA